MLLNELPVDGNQLLPRCKEAMRQMNAALSFLYNAPLFLEENECRYIADRGMFFIQAYTDLAQRCFNLGRPHLFPLFPKVHAAHHCWHTLQSQADLHHYGLNPLRAACQMDEDVIGRVSRVSRRVSIKTVARRTLERHLLGCYAVWSKAGVLK